MNDLWSLLSRGWALALCLCLSVPAHAFSRIVIVTADQVSIALDGVPIPAAIGNRTTLRAIPAGPHTIAIYSLSGQALHQEAVQVPDNADVHIDWQPGANFVITGATSAGPGGGAGGNYANDTPTGVAQNQTSWTNSTGGTTSTGTLGPASGPRPTDFMVGNGGQGTGTHGRAAQTLTGSGTAETVVSAGMSGFQSMTYGAKAGTNFGTGTGAFRQQIKRANVVYGSVVFIKNGGPPVRIYHDGMLVAELPAGASTMDANLEVGRRALEFRSAVDHGLWYQGDLMVDRSHVIQLAFDDRAPPKPQVRPWLWQSY